MTKLAFVDSNRIICDNAIVTPCQFNMQRIYLEDTKRVIEVSGNQVTLGVLPVNTFEKVNFMYTDFTQLNYKHNNELIVGIDLTKFYLSLNAIKDNINKIPVLYFPSKAAILFQNEKFKIISAFEKQIKNTIHIQLLIIVSIVSAVLILLSIYCCCKHKQHLNSKLTQFHQNHPRIFGCIKKNRNHRNNEEIEMNYLNDRGPRRHAKHEIIEHEAQYPTVIENNDSYVTNLNITPAYPNSIYKSSDDHVRFRPTLINKSKKKKTR